MISITIILVFMALVGLILTAGSSRGGTNYNGPPPPGPKPRYMSPPPPPRKYP